MRIIYFFLFFFGLSFLPSPAHAASFFDNLSCEGTSTLSLDAFLYLFVQIAQIILGVTGSLALLMFVWGGFMWLISAGSQKMVEMGRTTLINALIGLLVIFGSWLFIDFIISTLAPGVKWKTFSGNLCTDVKKSELGDAIEPPPAVAATPAQQQMNQAQSIAALNKPLECKPEAEAQMACALCPTKKPVGTLTGKLLDTTEDGRPCGVGNKRCVCENSNGESCPDIAPTPAESATCRCGTEINPATGAREQLTPAGPPRNGETRTNKNGKSYVCCKCVLKKFLTTKQICGESVPDIKTLEGQFLTDKIDEKYTCCPSARQQSNLNLCTAGGVTLTLKDQKCYCISGQVGSPCSVSNGGSGGCQAGLKCSVARALQWQVCKWSWSLEGAWNATTCALGNVVVGLAKIPTDFTGDMARDLFGQTTFGFCIDENEPEQ